MFVCGKENSVRNCIVYLILYSLGHIILGMKAVAHPDAVDYIVIFIFLFSIGCIVGIVGEIIAMKMRLEGKSNIKNVRNRFIAFLCLWCILMIFAHFFLIYKPLMGT